jgi:hypothetical protein
VGRFGSRGAIAAALAGLLLALVASSAIAAFSGPVGTTDASGTTGATGTTGSTGSTGAPTGPPHIVACPVNIATATVSSAQWLWSNFGAPSSSATKVSYSQSGGSGSWSATNGGEGTARGTICSQDQGGGQPKRSIVLKVSGASKLSPGTTRLGLLGVGLKLSVTVSKSGDPAVCPVGSTGSVTLFASYYSTHADKVTMSFAGTCAAWNESFSGSSTHVKLADDGAMIRPGSV